MEAYFTIFINVVNHDIFFDDNKVAVLSYDSNLVKSYRFNDGNFVCKGSPK